MSEEQGAINVYVCEACSWSVVTKNLVAGTTTFTIGCERCRGICYSAFYRVSQDLEPTHEWFKPATDEELIAVVDHELATLGKRGKRLRKQRTIILEDTREHVRLGGLLLRKFGADA